MAGRVNILTDLGSLDLLQGVENEFYVTRQIHDLRSFETRNADYTKTIQVPPTPNNVAILDAYQGSKGRNKIPCQIIMDGITIAPSAFLLFSSSTLSNNETAYDVVIFYGNFNLFDSIVKGTIDEMNWADLAYNMADPVAVVALSQNTEQLVTPLADWVTRSSREVYQSASGGVSLFMELNIMGFFVYVKEIIKRIIEEAGFTVAYATNLPADFFQLALAAPVTKRFEITETTQLSFTNNVSNNADQSVSNTADVAVFQVIGNNSSGYWDIPSNSWIIGVDFIPGELKIVVQGTFEHEEQGNRPASEIRIIQNGATIATFSTDTDEPPNTPFYLTITINAIPGDNLWVELFSAVNQTTLTLEAGSEFLISTPGEDRDPTVQPSEWIPQLGKSDFIASILKLFNLVMQTDDITKVVSIQPFDDIYDGAEQDLTTQLNVGSKEIASENSLASLAQNSWFKWTGDNLLRRDFDAVVEFENQTLAKEIDVITMSFSPCDNSVLHFDANSDTFLKAKLPSAAIEEELPSLGLVTVAITGAFTVDEQGGSFVNFQVGDWFGLLQSGNLINWYRVIDKYNSISGQVQPQIHASDIDTPRPMRNFKSASAEDFEPRLAIIRSDGGESNYFACNGSTATGSNKAPYVPASLTANWMDSLKMQSITDTYYANILGALQTPETLKAWFNIPVAQFVQLDFMRPVYLQNLSAFYYINKINQYKAGGNQVQLELVRINKFE